MKGSTCEHGVDQQQQPRTRCPLYAVRQPPLVQPLETSAFVERTLATFGVRDLGREWVTIFQAIGVAGGGYSTSMKLAIPETILLSPSGLPSVWYSTSTSSHLQPRNLARVTPRSIFDALVSNAKRSSAPARGCAVAIRRVGFDVEALTLCQLTEFVAEMEHPRVLFPRHDGQEDGDDSDDDSCVADRRASGEPAAPLLRAFCLQQFIERECDALFLVLWRCKHRSHGGTPPRDNASDGQYARSFYKRPLPLLSIDVSCKCDVFLSQRVPRRTHQRGDSVDETNDDDGDDASEDTRLEPASAVVDRGGNPHASLVHLDLESPTLFKDALLAHGFASDAIVSQLCHMKLTASEILNRVNRGLHARQACGARARIACEFFVGARDKRVYFSGLAGTHWENAAPSWETLRHVDPTSSAIAEFLHARRTTKRSPAEAEAEAALRLFSELNPRFPSVHSPLVSEQQWRFQSPLLPPDVSPRYIGAQVPKSYRDGRFHALLTATQADSVNRLHLSPRPPVALLQHPLSKQFAKLGRLARGSFNASTSGLRSPLSLRTHAKRSTATPHPVEDK
ncbi:hypothetical protein PybrP1_008876 [[Pythium] brassicae (nom. inval.)]|nr:hypothetical protein PybrP1_008876 [[Pythium] brassicae (nom. inval.)]